MPSVRPGDLRSEAKDVHRVKNHKAKWARGALPAPGKTCTHTSSFNWPDTCADCAKRPLGEDGRTYEVLTGGYSARSTSKASSSRAIYKNEIDEAIDDHSDVSAAEDVDVAPEPDNEIMYSFDAHAGPGQGSQILRHAIAQAVERFENKETEKIVKEYDLVADGKEDLEFADAEDDFELVDKAHIA